MILAVLFTLGLILVVLFIVSLLVPSNLNGLGLGGFGGVLTFFIWGYVFYLMTILGERFGYKDVGVGNKSSFFDYIWFLITLIVSGVIAVISGMLLV